MAAFFHTGLAITQEVPGKALLALSARRSNGVFFGVIHRRDHQKKLSQNKIIDAYNAEGKPRHLMP